MVNAKPQCVDLLTSKREIFEAINLLSLVDNSCQAKIDLKVERLVAYVEMMIKWNRTYNLTALTSFQEILSQHIYDSLAVLPSIQSHFKKNGIAVPKIIDVGSGAGLPGVVMAIMEPNYKVQCVDAVEKKTSFIRAVKGQIGLKNLTVTHARIEQMAPLQANLVISRAFASLRDFVELAQKHVVVGGVMVGMKAKNVQEEITLLERHHHPFTISKIEPITVPNNNAARCLVWLEKE